MVQVRERGREAELLELAAAREEEVEETTAGPVPVEEAKEEKAAGGRGRKGGSALGRAIAGVEQAEEEMGRKPGAVGETLEVETDVKVEEEKEGNVGEAVVDGQAEEKGAVVVSEKAGSVLKGGRGESCGKY